jgi:predicted dienelactone hydrolase
MKKFTVLVFVLFLALGAFTGPTSAQDPDAELPLAECGPHGVGQTTVTLVDESREERELVTEIWYPAVVPEDQRPCRVFSDAEPDDSDAPYPLILYSHGYGAGRLQSRYLGAHLASHGYVVSAMDHRCDRGPTCLTDRPMDILFVLNELVETGENNLAALIDPNHAGVIGYSDGGYTTLSLNGARFDPMFFSDWWDEHGDGPTVLGLDLWSYPWDEIVSYRAQFDTLEAGELWPPIFDERIQAVMPIAPCYGPLFGERGLATATVPTLIVGATHDEYCSYPRDSAFMYEHLGSEHLYLLTLINARHTTLNVPGLSKDNILNHFSTAFFGYHLRDQEEYSHYLTEEYVTQFEGFDWGVYQSE